MYTAAPEPMKWWGWGEPSKTYPLEHRPGFWPFLFSKIGAPSGSPAARVNLDQIRIPPLRIPARALEALTAAVGAEHLSLSADVRIAHSCGRGYQDLIRLRQGEVPRPPDAVVFPSSEEVVVPLLRISGSEGLAVIPFGGGTSVVGGVEAPDGDQPVLCVDLRGMSRLISADPAGLVATAEAGILGPALEASLSAHGLTLGHFPQSFEFSTLGGWIATRSAGYASTGYGKIEAMVIALRVVTPRGIIATRVVPASASGPDLNALFAGSEGTLGIITQATLRVHPLTAKRDYRAWLFRGFPDGLSAVRAMLQEGPIPTTVRLSDAPETEAYLTMRERRHGWPSQVQEWAGMRVIRTRGFAAGRMCAAIIGVEGSARVVSQSWHGLGRLLGRHGAFPLGSGPARAWYRERFELPYLRDELLDAGIMVDTLETAAPWDRLLPLHARVADALRDALTSFGTPPLVLCHLSHAYPTGASLYFTFMAHQAPGREMEQWQAAKRAATDAIMAGGGTLSHHHGIGTVHQAWMHEEHGKDGLQMVRAIKTALDPDGIMNPGKMVP
ncbi:MAG: FAD-binding oxidoreductase [Armatimonadetes bacterium]|nr:FAD-binding oxidoreductase [Armatimonadota bacterium]